METVIERFTAVDEVDEFTRSDGWRRFPVMNVAEVFDVSRETVHLRMAAMEQAGAIERPSIAYRHDGAIRRDMFIR